RCWPKRGVRQRSRTSRFASRRPMPSSYRSRPTVLIWRSAAMFCGRCRIRRRQSTSGFACCVQADAWSSSTANSTLVSWLSRLKMPARARSMLGSATACRSSAAGRAKGSRRCSRRMASSGCAAIPCSIASRPRRSEWQRRAAGGRPEWASASGAMCRDEPARENSCKEPYWCAQSAAIYRGGAMEARGQARVERRLAAILAADVAGYSRLMEADEEGTLAALRAIRHELGDPKIAEHRGRIVKTTGDGWLVEFPSVVDAVRCAVEVQREMTERNAEIPQTQRIEFRFGINLGDIIIDEHDIYGDGVNIAARLEALAEPGGIYVSRVVRDQVRDKLDVAFEDIGEQQVKNIARPVRVYRIPI